MRMTSKNEDALLAPGPAHGKLRSTPLLARLWPELRAIWYLHFRVLGLWILRSRLRRQGQIVRLNVGSGNRTLKGWVNVDLLPYRGVDLVADVTHGLPFTNVSLVFAEHFLEHLEILKAIHFLIEVHRILNPSGKLRLSTPNLDWVWKTHYSLTAPSAEREAAAVTLNRAFYAWEHRFLWNRELLQSTLEACGFTDIRWYSYGQSDDPELRGLEHHETYSDEPGLPHVLIVEAVKGKVQEPKLRLLKKRIYDEFVFHLG